MIPFMKFCVVGASGVLVDMGILWLLTRQATFAASVVLAKIIATELAIVNNFLWNDNWTFRQTAKKPSSTMARFLRFNAICIAGLCLNVVLFSILAIALRMSIYTANAFAIVLVAGVNYGLSRRYGWQIGQRTENASL